MSDLEARTAHGVTTAPITVSAVRKLRSFQGSGKMFAATDGISDAFSEVFAQIAQSQSVPAAASQRQSDEAPVAAPHRPSPTESNAKPRRAEVQREPAPRPEPTESESEFTRIQPKPEQASPSRSNTDSPTVDVEQSLEESVEEVAVADVQVTTEPRPEVTAPTVPMQKLASEDGETQQRKQRSSEKTEAIQTTEKGGREAARETHVQTAKQTPMNSSEVALTRSTVGEQQATETPASSEGQSRRQLESIAALSEKTPEDSVEDTPRRPKLKASGDQPGAEAAKTSVRPQTEASSLNKHAGVQPGAATAATSASSAGPSAPMQTQVQSQTQAQTRTQMRASQSGPALRSTSVGLEADRNPQTPRGESAKTQKPARGTSETVSRAKLIQRVSKAFQHLGPDGGVVRMRLAPAEMGSVRVEMRVQQRKVHARVVAETEAASAALRQFLPDLRQRLEAQGMQLERIEIEHESSDGDLGHDFQHSQRETGDPDGRWQRPRRSGWRAAESNEVSSPVSRSESASVLHVSTEESVDIRY